MASLPFTISPNPYSSHPKTTPITPKTLHRNAQSNASPVPDHFAGLCSLFAGSEPRDAKSKIEMYGQLLQACVYDRDLSLGRQIHARIAKNGGELAGNEFLEAKLVILYAKCDDRLVADRTFRASSSKNVFSWAAIIGMNCRLGFCEEGLLGYRQMIESGLSPDNFVVPNALKACGALRWIKLGKCVHGFVFKSGLGDCVFVKSSLVDFYGKCGELDGARSVFDKMSDRNTVTWNSLIVGYVQNGMNEEAMEVFREMRIEGVEPTHVTLSGFLSASANVGAVKEGKQGHAVAVLEGVALNTKMGSSVMNFYCKVGLLEEAELVFSMMLNEKDVVTWNLMISGYVQAGDIEKALEICRNMRLEKLRFDSVTLTSLISGSADTANLKLGKVLHCYCIRNGLESEVVVASTIVNMYAKCRKIDLARRVFDSVTRRDLVLWNTILAAYAELGQSGEALTLFYAMQLQSVPPNTVSWNSVILGFLKNKKVNEAKEAFLQMRLVGVEPNLVTWTTLVSGLAENGFGNEAISESLQMQEAGIRHNTISLVSLLSVCVDMAFLQYGKSIHGYVVRHFRFLSTRLATSLVDMYAKCGNLEKAMKFFDNVEEKDVPVYNAMISGFALHGQAKEALELYRCLEKEGKIPDSITFTNALYACSHCGLVNEGFELLVEMVSKHGLKPGMVHYGCMVKLLSQSGNFEKALGLVNAMPFAPDAHILGSLLGFCRENGEIELAETLSRKLMELEPDNSGNYVALSNAYAASGKWDRVEETRGLMKENRILKTPGCSWIPIGDEVHVFVAGDKFHRKTEQIYRTLALLRLEVCQLL